MFLGSGAGCGGSNNSGTNGTSSAVTNSLGRRLASDVCAIHMCMQGLLQQYKAQLVDDPIVHTHLSELYDRLLEQNLLRLIEPFSRVEIAHIAKLIGLSLEVVERKLSQVLHMVMPLSLALRTVARCTTVRAEGTRPKP